MSNLVATLTAAAAIGSALVAGIFFAFSTFVMTALGRLPAAQGIAAMQSINVAVLNPAFFAAFFGTGLLCLAAAVLGFAGGAGALPVAGALLYLFGCIGVTIGGNVPLNNALAAVAADGADAARLWLRYRVMWTRWNHVRTAAALVAAVLFLAALA